MSIQNTILFSLGLAASVLAGCSSSDSQTPDSESGGAGVGGAAPGAGGAAPGAGGSATPGGGGTATGAGGSTAAAKCEDVNYASYASGQPTMSFKTDIMPIFGFGCVASGCHSKGEHKANLDLGVKCDYDAATKTCNYTTNPLDDATLQGVYDSLMGNSTTVQSPPTKRIIAGDPEHSFLIEKLSGNMNQAAYTCESQDKSHAVDPNSKCGDSMPLGGNRLCDGSSRYKFDKIAAWIQQGAQKN